MRKVVSLGLVLLLVLGLTSVSLAGAPGGKGKKGFNEAGYNRVAKIFNGTGWEWCMEKVGSETWCENYLGDYADDKLIMKWNSEWDRGNEEGWTNPPYRAWTTNHWNGKVPGGSGETWFYKFVWNEGCVKNSVPSQDTQKGAAYCIWGQFAVVMSHGTVGNEHIWEVLLKPAGI